MEVARACERRRSLCCCSASREGPPKALGLRLRLPKAYKIACVTMSGKPFRRLDAATGTIDLSGETGSLELRVAYSKTP